MSQTAAHLVDHVIPQVPVRQWVLSLPIPLRLLLAAQPELVLLDELMAGLNQTEIIEAMDLVRKIRDRGVTIIMIEHVMKAIMNVCDRIIVLNYGKKIAEGTPQEIANSKIVVEVYLGE